MSQVAYARMQDYGFPLNNKAVIKETFNRYFLQTNGQDISHIPPGVVYRLVRPSRHTVWWNKTNKWTQTDSQERASSLNPQDYWRHGTLSHSVLQIEINRLIDWYHLTGSRDLNIQLAVSDLMSTFRDLPNNKTIRKVLQTRISKTITYRKYYGKKKQIALATGRSIQDVLNRGRKEENVHVRRGTDLLNPNPDKRIHLHEY